MKFTLTYADAIGRIAHVLEAVTTSEEWKRESPTLAASDWMEVRQPFRRFFDVFEGQNGQEWLGIMEWAVLEEIRSTGAGLAADTATQRRIVTRMADHPNIELAR